MRGHVWSEHTFMKTNGLHLVLGGLCRPLTDYLTSYICFIYFCLGILNRPLQKLQTIVAY